MAAVYATVQHQFSPPPENTTEMNLDVGDVVRIISQDPSGWWEGELNGKVGLFPSNYVDVMVESMSPAAMMGQPQQLPNQHAAVSIASAPQGFTKGLSTPNLDVANKVVATRWGLWATNQAQYVGMLYCLCGAFVLLTALLESVDGDPSCSTKVITDEDACLNTGATWFVPLQLALYEVLCGAWALVAGLLIFFYEFKYGATRTSGKFQFRVIVYLIAVAPGCFVLPTRFPAALMLVPVVCNLFSLWRGESHTPYKKRGRATQKLHTTKCQSILEKIGGKNPEGRKGRMFIIILWFGANVYFGQKAFFSTLHQIEAKEANNEVAFTRFVPVAKFFGHVMDFNFTFLLLPVSRSGIRWLYNNSNGRTTRARVIKQFLNFVPLDQSIKFHKIFAWTGFFAAIGHVFAHLLNYYWRSQQVWDTYKWGVWITGSLLLLILLLIFSASHRNVKVGHFELFWMTHMLFPLFLLTNLLHGAKPFNTDYWKYLLVPGGLFFIERVKREMGSRRPVSLCSVAFLNGGVLNITVGKVGSLEKEYRVGQYVFICVPEISRFEWHPFTISSAPQEETVSFHIRVQAEGSWTYSLNKYLQRMCLPGQVLTEFTSSSRDGSRAKGKVFGPDGKQMLRIYGPHSAPTQHLTEYNEVLLCTSGIGVTPLAAAMKSIVNHKWKFFSGRCFPDRATFVWITSHKEIGSFRWFIRTIKEVDDAVHDMIAKTPGAMTGELRKHFKIHLFITSFNAEAKTTTEYPQITGQDPQVDAENDMAFWGQKTTDAQGRDTVVANYTERDLLDLILDPSVGTGTNDLGHVTVHNGRPDWDPIFGAIGQATVDTGTTGNHVGVTFCGNPGIGAGLTQASNTYTKKFAGKCKFHLHKEVF